MIMDALLLFDGSVNAQGTLSGTTVTSGTNFTSGATTDSVNIIDVSQIASSASGRGRDIGVGDDPALKIAIMVTSAFTSSGNATLQVELQTAPDSGSGTPGMWTPIVYSETVPVAGLVAGYSFLNFKIPPGVQKYLKLTYLVGTANMTAGAIIAGMVLDREQLGPALGYPSGYSTTYI